MGRPYFARRHYEDIADAIYRMPENPSKEQVIAEIARVFGSDNGNFDSEKFVRYCSQGHY